MLPRWGGGRKDLRQQAAALLGNSPPILSRTNVPAADRTRIIELWAVNRYDLPALGCVASHPFWLYIDSKGLVYKLLRLEPPMGKWMGMLLVSGLCLLTGAECQPGGGSTEPIAAGTYRGTISGESKLTEMNGTLLQSSSSQATLTLVFNDENRPISLNVETPGGVSSQTIVAFNVTQTQRFQYSYNDGSGKVDVDYTARVIRSEYAGGAYVVEYSFDGTQTSAFGVTTMSGKNKYSFFNQTSGLWVLHNQESTLTPPGNQSSLKSSLIESGLLIKTN